MVKQKQSSWIHCKRPNLNAKLRLFCFPYAGGNASIYREWFDELPLEVEVNAIQLPGRGERLLEAPLTSLKKVKESLIEELLPYLDKPFAFFGHSMGALTSFEIARSLPDKYRSNLIHLFLSAFRAVQLPRKKESKHTLPNEELKLLLKKLNGTPDFILENQEMLDLILPVMRADLQILDTYEYVPERKVDCDLTVFGGTQDKITKDELESWCSQTTKSFELKMFSGDHFFIHNNQELILKNISQVLLSL